jgi:sarcosine oxidase subunit beta
MIRQADAVVVGGGVNGAATAYHLVAQGAGRVVLLDVPSPRAATAKSGAMLTLHHPALSDAVLAHQGLLQLLAFAELTGLDTGFRRTGIVQIFPGRHADALRRNLAAQRAAGIPVGEIPVADLGELLPGGDFTDVGAALLEPESGYADPLRTTWAYREAAVRGGAIVERSRAQRILTGPRGVLGVETEHGTISAPVVVLAAGAWSAGLLADLGVDLGLSIRRVQISRFRVERPGHGGRPVLLDQITGAWVRPDGESAVLAGLELGLPVSGPQDGDESADQWYVDLCRTRLTGRFAGFADAQMRGGWAGLITMGPDGRPIVDRLAEADGLYCVVGDSGGAFKTAPVVGRCIAEWITDGRPRSADLGALARDREPTGTASDGYGRFAAAARLAREIPRPRPTGPRRHPTTTSK